MAFNFVCFLKGKFIFELSNAFLNQVEIFAIKTCRNITRYYSAYCALYSFVPIEKVKQPVPLQAWTDPDGSSRVRLPDFKTIGT